MNQTLQEEELDRHLVLQHYKTTFGNGETYERITKAKVTPKKLTITSDRGGKSICFEKCSGNELLITGKKLEVVYETCSLGHRHEKSKKEHEYDWFRIDDEHLTQIAEWLNSGTWTDIQGSKAPYKRIMRQALELIETMEKYGDFKLMNAQIKKIKKELKNELGDNL